MFPSLLKSEFACQKDTPLYIKRKEPLIGLKDEGGNHSVYILTIKDWMVMKKSKSNSPSTEILTTLFPHHQE